MRKQFTSIWTMSTVFAVALAMALPLSSVVQAHCDQMDGPVVVEAQAALEEGDVTRVLKWVMAEDEQEIREAFDRTLAVRELSPEAKALADQFFFETLVRVHRASEGVAFTGINPAGTPVAPGVARADQALEEGSVDELATELGKAVEESIREQFKKTMAAREKMDESVEAGRTYVHEYVPFVHYVKAIHETVTAGPEAHGHAGSPLSDDSGHHHHH